MKKDQKVEAKQNSHRFWMPHTLCPSSPCFQDGLKQRLVKQLLLVILQEEWGWLIIELFRLEKTF